MASSRDTPVPFSSQPISRAKPNILFHEIPPGHSNGQDYDDTDPSDLKRISDHHAASSSSHKFKATCQLPLTPIEETEPVTSLDNVVIKANTFNSDQRLPKIDALNTPNQHPLVNPAGPQSISGTSTPLELPEETLKASTDLSSTSNSTHEDELQNHFYARSDKSDHLKTVTELEELEINEFLRRNSKRLQEFNVQSFEAESTPPPLPKLNDFRSTGSGKIHWVNFCDAYAAAQLERYCPSGLLTSSAKAPVSISQLKAHASRGYVTIFPTFWSVLSTNKLCSIYCWDNPRQTAFYLLTYYLLWLGDLIPSFIVGYALYLLIDRQLNPPTDSQLRQEANERHHLGQQAEAMESEGLCGVKNDLSSSVAKGVMGNPSLYAGIAIGPTVSSSVNSNDPPPNFAQPLPDMHNYRGIYTFSRSIYAEHRHQIQNLLADLADIGEKVRNLYLWRRPHACWRTMFMLIVILMYTLTISQKWLVKNFLGWLGIEFFFLLGFTEKHPKFRRILNPTWILLYGIPTDSEFVLDILQDRGRTNRPNHHKILKKTRKNLSNHRDSKSSYYSSNGKRPKRNSFDQSSINSFARSRRESTCSEKLSVRSVLEIGTWKRLGHKLATGSTEAFKFTKKVDDRDYERVPDQTKFLDEKIIFENKFLDSGSSSEQECNVDPVALKTFAILNARLPGNLTVTAEGASFKPFKGFRTKTLRLKSNLNQSEPPSTRPRTNSSSSSLSASIKTRPKSAVNEDFTKTGDCYFDGFTHDPADSDKDCHTCNLLIPFSDIIKIKKVKKSIILGVGLKISDGIELHLENSTVLSFDHIINRDDYFNQFLIICTAYKNRYKQNHKKGNIKE